MEKVEELLAKVICTCDFRYEGNSISKEHLMEAYFEFLSKTVSEDKHNLGMVLHTGTICFDVIAVLFGALTCIIMCENNLLDIVDSLKKGDTVLYGTKKKQRYTFDGFLDLDGKESENYVRLSQSDVSRTCIPKKSWNKIEPYNGNSSRMDGRGIRRVNVQRYAFIASLLNTNQESVPGVSDKSVVIVMSRYKADMILSGLSIKFGGGNVSLLEIVTASYFTEGDEYFYGGNPGKTDAVLKITGKVSIARDLILDNSGNEVIGTIILGTDIITRGGTELIEIMKRKSLRYVFLACNIDSENAKQWIDECEGLRVFACTKEKMCSIETKVVVDNRYTRELSRQVAILKEKYIEKVIVSENELWNEADEVKKALMFIRKTDFISEQKECYVIKAYSLLNLFLNSVFPIFSLEQLIDDGIITIQSPAVGLEELKQIEEALPKILQEKAEIISDILQKFYNTLFDFSEKYELLIEYVKKYADKKIAIIIPKAYYENVLVSLGITSYMWDPEKLSISTANRFDNSIVYDVILVAGDIKGKRFDLFRCMVSPLIITFIYEFQKKSIEYKYIESQKLEQFYNRKAGYVIDSAVYSGDSDINDGVIKGSDDIDDELEEYILQINNAVTNQYITYYATGSNVALKSIVAIGTFGEGEKIFFTKAYKAYVLDDYKEDVQEVEVQNLVQGDKLIFTNNSQVTKDIVDLVLEELISTDTLSEEIKIDYQKSKYWKKKLKDYKRINNLSYQQIADGLKKYGSTKHPVTIRTWLDEDLHIVGPKDSESFRQIADMVQDEELLNAYNDYRKACDVIRHLRIKILKQIALSIVNKYKGKVPQDDPFLELVYENVNDLAVVLQLTDIVDAERQMPVNLTNKPIAI